MISYFGLPRHDENNFYDGCYLDVISGNVLNQLCTYRKDRKGITYALEDPGVRFCLAVCSLQWVTVLRIDILRISSIQLCRYALSFVFFSNGL